MQVLSAMYILIPLICLMEISDEYLIMNQLLVRESGIPLSVGGSLHVYNVDKLGL